jgi:hypothetical protein
LGIFWIAFHDLGDKKEVILYPIPEGTWSSVEKILPHEP